jgi:hypothetical protein
MLVIILYVIVDWLVKDKVAVMIAIRVLISVFSDGSLGVWRILGSYCQKHYLLMEATN